MKKILEQENENNLVFNSYSFNDDSRIRNFKSRDRRSIKGPNEVLIGPNAVVMPAGRILLVKKDSCYCAIKFIR